MLLAELCKRSLCHSKHQMVFCSMLAAISSLCSSTLALCEVAHSAGPLVCVHGIKQAWSLPRSFWRLPSQ